MSILFVGGTVVDIIFPGVRRLPAFPSHTEFTPSNLVLLDQPPVVTIGGNGANAAYVAARFGAACDLHSNLAPDSFGALAAEWLGDAGVRMAPGTAAARTAVNVTANNPRMQRATFFYPGATPVLPRRLPPGTTHALVCGWPHPPTALLARSLRRWRQKGVMTAYDAGPLLEEAPTLENLSPILAGLDLFLSNEHELCTLSRSRNVTRAISALRARFVGEIVIKLGPRGCLWSAAGSPTAHLVPGLRVKAVNTVGAGDTFNGTLMAGLAGRLSFLSALRSANRAGASVVSSGKGVLGLRIHALASKKVSPKRQFHPNSSRS